MWREQIKQFRERWLAAEWGGSATWIGHQLQFDAGPYTLSNGEQLLLKLSDTECIPAMVTVEKAAYNGDVSWDKRDILYDMTQNKQAFYIQAFIAAELVAFIGLRRDVIDVHISNIVVHPDKQSLSIGHILIREAKAYTKQLNKRQLSLEVRVSNERAQQFYARHGFKKGAIKKRYYLNDREDALIMKWQQEAENSDQSVG